MDEQAFLSTNKLLRHVERLAEWRQDGITRAPISVGVALTNICNHRCPACNGAPGLLGLKGDTTSIPFDLLERLVPEMAALGVKAVPLAGGGDPTCHPRAADALRLFKQHGIETGMFTNGQLLRDDLLEAANDCLTWIRISLDADNPAMYAQTHGMGEGDWRKVLHNIERLVAARRASGSPIVIGTSMLIGPHTMAGIVGAARIARDLGADYLRLRPFFTWDGKLPFSREQAEEVRALLAEAASLATPDFKVAYPSARTDWIADGAPPPAPYKACHIHHFTTQIQPDCKLYLCCHTLDNPKYCLGDLRQDSFGAIWRSERRRNVFENIDYADCATPCQMMSHNALLDFLDTPLMHENFI